MLVSLPSAVIFLRLQTLLEERRLLQEKLKKYHDRNAELKKRIKMSTDEKIQVLTHDNEKLKTKCSNLQREVCMYVL